MNSNTIDIVKKELCSGCSACYNVCPKDAIKMEYDEEGFLFPLVDEDKCVSCGLCKGVCPALSPYKENDLEPKVYIVKREERYAKESTSAGVFAALAEYVLENNGYVCGAVYDEKFEVHHWITNDQNGVKRIKQSKYVQSEIGLVYREIKELLDKGELVLFSGTPCQVSGITKFLRKKYDNLITFDIICHGAPAPLSWKRYLDENVNRDKLKNIDFRHKGNHGFMKLHICFSYKNGKKEVVKSPDNSYYYHFLRDLGLRNSCTHCEGAIVPRVGDFSAGDYWGAKKHFPELIESDKGISVIFVNNGNARKIFEKIKDKFSFIQEITVVQAMAVNRANVSRNMHLNRERFFEMLKYMSFNDAVKKNVGRPFDIAIYGNTMSVNYGVLMGYYALYKFLHNEGCGVVMIPIPKFNNSKKLTHAQRFMKENVVLAPANPLAKFSEYNIWGDTFLLGPDQLWNQNLFKHRQFNLCLDFVNREKKKVAYASSFGNKFAFEDENDSDYQKIRSLLEEFDNVAMTDDVTIDIAKQKYNMLPEKVMDPIFLLESDEYNKVANKAVNKIAEKIIAVYVLDEKEDFRKAVSFASDYLHLPCVNMGNGNYEKLKKQQKKSLVSFCENLQVEEWLNNIKNSEFVITDSYYAVCFALIFKKNFIVIQSKIGIAPLEELLSKLNLEGHWFKNAEELIKNVEILNQNIDYNMVDKILEKEVKKSKEWLKHTLGYDVEMSRTVESVSDERNKKTFWEHIKNVIKH